MTDLAIITPSRGRPAMAASLVDEVRRLSHLDTRVYLGVDDDDPDAQTYREYADSRPALTLFVDGRRNLVQWTNHLAGMLLQSPVPPRYLASLGDDHRPRTPGWDALLVEAIEARGGTGFAYGNDLYQGAALPTAWVVSADIVRALGYMMVPALRHLFVDNAAKDIGEGADCISYVPGALVEHLHPVAHKGAWDESYLDSNSRQRYADEGAAYAAWRAEALPEDIRTVQSVMSGAWSG